MKVIVSHDVDHLYPSDHIGDLYFPKLWIRSLIQLISGHIDLKTFGYRLIYIFNNRINRIPELCDFDLIHHVKATYFFGMANALGMSYKKGKALPWIQFAKERGFDVGVHGCDYQHFDNIQKEHDDFRELTGIESFGIRNHYVRYDSDTFRKISDAGYVFDTTEFNKNEPEYKDPYKIGTMWEFPLALMDVYIYHHDLQKAKDDIMSFINTTIENKGKYLTILFHDALFDSRCYPKEKELYEWLVVYIENLGLEFISYADAINELNNERKH